MSAVANNPFDDSFEESKIATNNPFDNENDDHVVHNTYNNGMPLSSPPNNNNNNNPFMNDRFDKGNLISTDDDDEEDSDSDDDEVPEANSSAPAEASWQYLGDLPYRRVPIYSNVRWNRKSNTHANADGGSGLDEPSNSVAADQHGSAVASDLNLLQHGLASFPPAALKHHPNMLDRREVRALLNSSTVTKVVGCPGGGPIAAMTLPVSEQAFAGGFTRTELRIMTCSGKPLAKIEFPPSELLEQYRRYSPADVMTIGFTSRTELIIVLRDSLCLTYDLRGDPILQPFHIFPRGEAKGNDLLQATVYEGGVAVLASNKNAALVELLDDHDDPEYLQSAHLTARRIAPSSTSDLLAGGQDATPPHYALVTHLPTEAHASKHFCSYMAIAVLPRTRTTSRHPEIFLSTSDCSVIVVNAATTEVVDVECRARISTPIVDMSFAPNGRFLACFTESSMLTVISTSFETKVLDFDTSEGSSSPPLAMEWCGEDSVVLHWKNLGVLMVGPYGDWLRFPYQGMQNVYLLPEMDCCRVISDSSVEILQRVPPATALLLRIGSIETAAMLLDASDAFDNGSPSSDEAARAIVKTGLLTEAIETCTDAAVKEFDIATQKRLLRAASYGMHFSCKVAEDKHQVMGGPVNINDPEKENGGVLPSPTAIKFVEASRKLRILNALRDPSVGIVLTMTQFDAITSTGIVARLIAMKRPALATAISKYLSLPKSVQLFARASKAAAFVETASGISDSEVAEGAIHIINGDTSKALQKSGTPSINRGAYATVAFAASKAGKPGVANLLLMLESSVADKVPVLISTGAYADAMAVATSARDADYIFSTLMEFERACLSVAPPGDIPKAQAAFLGTVVSKFTPEAFHTLRRYLGTTADAKAVTSLLVRAQKFNDAGAAMSQRALREHDPREKQGVLAEASRIFGLGKETAFDKSCTDDFLELLKDQEVLRTKYGAFEVCPESSSVTATISSVIHYAASNVREQHRLLADADKIGKKFRIPEKRLWHIKVKAFAESEQWSNLRILGDSRAKPPIGYKPFARAVIRGKQPESEVLRYIRRITLPEERYDLFCEAALWKKALDEAFRMRDGRRIVNVKTLCNSNDIQLLAGELMAQLT